MVEYIRRFSQGLFDYAESYIPVGSRDEKFLLRSNFITLFVYSLVPIFIPVFLWLDAPWQALSAIGVALTAYMVLLLNKHFRRAHGRVFQLFIFGAWLFYYAWVFGEGSWAHYLYLAYAVIPLITFRLRKWEIYVPAFAGYVGLFWLVESDLTHFQGILEPEAQETLKLIVINLLFVWVFANFWLYNRSNIIFEQATRKAMGRLEQKNREMEQFVHIASHDLQEPLKTIHSFVELAKEETHKSPEEEQMYLDQIGTASEKMQGLIRALMHHSRLGNPSKERSLLNLNALLLEIQAKVAEGLGDKVSFEVDPLPEIRANEEDLRTLFEQLIFNGIKFSRPDQAIEIKVRYSLQGRYHRFEIEDNGIGIDGPNANTVFEIFRKLHHADQYPGLGVGLAYARKIVQAYDGDISFETAANGGSLFYFTLLNSN